MDETLTGTTIPEQSKTGCNGYEASILSYPGTLC